MKKSPTFSSELVCAACGKSVTRTGATQTYCPACRDEQAKLRKKRWYEKSRPTWWNRDNTTNKQTCAACGDKACSTFNGVPYCNKHWLRLKYHGTTELVGRKSTNKFVVDGNILRIFTKHGNEILADPIELPILSEYSWCISNTGYAVANINHRVTKMHRYILRECLNDVDVIDHANGNPLDNRRANLRVCTAKENARNSSISKSNKLGVKGVRLTESGKYNVRIVADGIEIYIGNYATIEEAVAARTEAEIKYHGAYASVRRRECGTQL